MTVEESTGSYYTRNFENKLGERAGVSGKVEEVTSKPRPEGCRSPLSLYSCGFPEQGEWKLSRGRMRGGSFQVEGTQIKTQRRARTLWFIVKANLSEVE